jgi:hypothetical protein
MNISASQKPSHISDVSLKTTVQETNSYTENVDLSHPDNRKYFHQKAGVSTVFAN